MSPYVALLVLVNASWSSPVCRFAVICTLAETSVVSSGWVTVTPGSIATGVETALSAARNEDERSSSSPPGPGLTSETARVAAALVFVPSVVVKETVRTE